MRIADIQLSFPSMLIALFLMSAFGTGIDKILISLTAVGWVVYARTVRGSTLGERQREYVQAARVAGLRDAAIMWRHILPNVMTPLIVVATVQVVTFILIEASLSFLGAVSYTHLPPRWKSVTAICKRRPSCCWPISQWFLCIMSRTSMPRMTV